MFLASLGAAATRGLNWPRDTTPVFAVAVLLSPRRMRVWEPSRALSEHSQWSAVNPVPEERALRAYRPPKRREPGNPRFRAECTSCTSCCPLSGRRPVTQGPWGALAYSFWKVRSARASPRHTPPSHRSCSELHSEKAAGAASSLAVGAASDDAVHAAQVLRREA